MAIQKNQIIGIFVGLLLILGGVLWYSNSQQAQTNADLTLTDANISKAWISATTDDMDRGSDADLVGSDPTSGTDDRSPTSITSTYRSEKYGFSFQHPADFRITELQEGEGDMILAQGSGEGRSFQIFVIPFDEAPDTYAVGSEVNVITPARIKQDVSDLYIESPQGIVVDDVPMLIFFSEHPSLGRTREAWFVYPPEPLPHGNYLYQILTYDGFDSELSKIMATWKFD